MIAFFASLLRCADASYHAGHTDDLALRLAQHAAGECGEGTAARLPVALVWSQEFATRKEAMAKKDFGKGGA